MATAVTTRQTSPEKKVSEKPTADGFTVKARMKNMKARYFTICSTSALVKLLITFNVALFRVKYTT